MGVFIQKIFVQQQIEPVPLIIRKVHDNGAQQLLNRPSDELLRRAHEIPVRRS